MEKKKSKTNLLQKFADKFKKKKRVKSTSASRERSTELSRRPRAHRSPSKSKVSGGSPSADTKSKIDLMEVTAKGIKTEKKKSDKKKKKETTPQKSPSTLALRRADSVMEASGNARNVEKAVKSWMDHLEKPDFKKTTEATFASLDAIRVEMEKCQVFKKNLDLCQSENVELLDANRVKGNDGDFFYHGSILQMPTVTNKTTILAQLAVSDSPSSMESFWLMIAAQKIQRLYFVLGEDEMDKKTLSEHFPDDFAEFKTIRVNNRKTVGKSDEQPNSQLFYEVVPKDCAEAPFCMIEICDFWPDAKIPTTNYGRIAGTAASVFDSDVDADATCAIMSNYGAGRAVFFPQEIAFSVRSQRPGAIETVSQYIFTYIIALHYSLKFVKDGGLKARIEKVISQLEQFGCEKMTEEDEDDNLTRGTDPYWKIMTEYDVPTLKQALVELGPFWFPTKMHVSDFLQDLLERSVNSPTYTLQRLLLSKLHQLSNMRNFQSFLILLSTYSVELGDAYNIDLTFESLYIKATCANELMPWDRAHCEPSTSETALILQPEHVRSMENCTNMYYQCLALLVNSGEHPVVHEKASALNADIFKWAPIARVFSAFLTNYDDLNTQKKCAEGFWRSVTPEFNDAQPPRGIRRGPEAEQRMTAARKQLAYLFYFLSLFRDRQLVNFISGYIVSLHNKVMNIQKRPHMKIFGKLTKLFDLDGNFPKLEITNLDDIRQLLETTIEKAYGMSRTDPDAIRTYADFLFVEKDYQGAAKKYLEYFAANDPTLRVSTSSDVFDDMIIQRLRICTAHSGYLTMSMLTCQWLQVGRRKAYQKAMEMLKNNETRDVGANCAEFVIDVTAVEMLSQFYQEMRMTKSLNTLYTGASSLSANQNVPGILTKQEAERRTAKLMTALASIYFGLHL
uniref:Tyrosine-protein phosphatase domain-containing protein n=1 Tax=Caenorhabditis tropicalis TaxID=1561998 RepID=A0A1I7UZS2_9PELO